MSAKEGVSRWLDAGCFAVAYPEEMCSKLNVSLCLVMGTREISCCPAVEPPGSQKMHLATVFTSSRRRNRTFLAVVWMCFVN